MEPYGPWQWLVLCLIGLVVGLLLSGAIAGLLFWMSKRENF